MAAILENLTLAQQEAALAVEFSRRLGNPSTLAIGLYSFALAAWPSDSVAARATLEEANAIIRPAGDSTLLTRALALLAQLQAAGGDLPGALEPLGESIDYAHINDDRPWLSAWPEARRSWRRLENTRPPQSSWQP
jgi:hypothetical protein